jgi:hypothetical protein
MLCKLELAKTGKDAFVAKYGSSGALAACAKQELSTVKSALASCKGAGSQDAMKACVAKALGFPGPANGNGQPNGGGQNGGGQQGGPGQGGSGQGGPGQGGPGQGHGNDQGGPGRGGPGPGQGHGNGQGQGQQGQNQGTGQNRK